ncbi:putative nucleotidyltransferase, Ribonuclease H [Helianthus annuus]|nr:putative nucleotidyltransferase, Ribonuclease H [Helianthus annuus]
MNEQVCELLKAGILREVRYQSWVANPVMVEKSNGGWRMCVDYTDLNKACPKDCYSLPEIDKKIDSLAPYRWKCFLDCYKGYHQVQMSHGTFSASNNPQKSKYLHLYPSETSPLPSFTTENNNRISSPMVD